jgi:hypothetical protein
LSGYDPFVRLFAGNDLKDPIGATQRKQRKIKEGERVGESSPFKNFRKQGDFFGTGLLPQPFRPQPKARQRPTAQDAFAWLDLTV